MTVAEILKQFESLANEKVRQHNIKYGAGDDQFGVKMGDIRTLAKKLKTNHELGLSLWATGNIEARLLATLILNPKTLSVQELDQMVRVARFGQLADWFNAYLVKEYPEKEMLRLKWLDSDDALALRAAWSLTAGRVARTPEGLNLDTILDQIENEMPNAAPETQWTMNTTLAQIGIHHPKHRARALEIGERLGIYRNFPVSKGCTSPFAPVWINEMVKREEKVK